MEVVTLKAGLKFHGRSCVIFTIEGKPGHTASLPLGMGQGDPLADT